MSAEASLLARHKAGDTSAFRQIFHLYKDGVYAYLVRCRIPNGTRDDLAQEIFMKIHGALDRFVPDKPLKAWVFTIVANTVRSYYRAVRPTDALEDNDEAAREPTSVEQLQGKETAAFLEDALQKLPLAEREVVVLFCIEELEQEAIAEILDMPVNTVKTHLRRGRLRLAQALHRRDTVMARESGK